MQEALQLIIYCLLTVFLVLLLAGCAKPASSPASWWEASMVACQPRRICENMREASLEP